MYFLRFSYIFMFGCFFKNIVVRGEELEQCLSLFTFIDYPRGSNGGH